MKKYIFQNRKGEASIIEVECQIISATEDPSVMWLHPGEYKVRISKPESFVDVWYSYAFYDSLKEAKVESEKLIRQEFDFSLRKYTQEYTEEQVQNAISKVKILTL
jgi:hypothetical protein